MKRIQPKTLLILNQVLERKAFSQKDILRSCNRIDHLSIGMVNRVINDMISKRYIAKISKWERDHLVDQPLVENGKRSSRRPKYYLKDPMGLLAYISIFRSMEDLLIFDIGVDATKQAIREEMKRFDIVYCLGSAMGSTSTYFRSDDVSFYSFEHEGIRDHLKTAKPGRMRIRCYRLDLVNELNKDNPIFKIDDSCLRTSDVQTVIDMFCDGKSAYTKPLLNKLWGIGP